MSRQVVIERTFRQSDFDRFATLSGDRNPIHVDAAFSARTRFGRTVAHGLMLVGVFRGLLERLAPGARLLRHAVMFPAPTYAGEAMQFTLTEQLPEGGRIRVSFRAERVSDGTVTCQGDAWLASPGDGVP